MRPIEGFRSDSEWRWDGTLWDFVDAVQWALVVRDIEKNNASPEWSIISNPRRCVDYANERGITRRAVVREMMRIATDGADMFRAIDNHDDDAE